MTFSRLIAWTLLAIGGFALFPTNRAMAQDKGDKLPRDNVSSPISEWREQRGIPKDKLKDAQTQFQNFAKYYADLISHPLIHKAAQDPSLIRDGAGITIPNVDTIIKGLDRFLLIPNPFERTASDNPNPKVNQNNADYIRELGIAMDAALKAVVENHPERVVRINAARLYAAVCRTGANAHWATVTAWLSGANVPTEIKYYALQAAANLLDAYDVFDYKGRRHSLSKEPRAEADREIGALVFAIQECILNPNTIVLLPGGKIDEKTTPDQLAVIGFVRKQAVKALGSTRFITLPGPDGKPIYPAHVLARVCVSDPTLLPAPSPAECAEAVIGLCNMAPVVGGNPVKGFNPVTLAEAVATGMITFAGPRAASPIDRSLAWRGYSARIGDAMKTWRPLFDPLFDPIAAAKADLGQTPKEIADLITRVQASILTPIDKVDAAGKPDLAARVDIEGMKAYLKTLQTSPKRTGLLINEVPATALPLPK